MAAVVSQKNFSESPDQVPHVDRGVALKSILVLWVFYYVINTLRMAIDAEPGQLDLMVRRGPVTVIGIVITLLMYLVLRRQEARSMRALITTALLISIPASIAYASANFTAFYLVSPPDSLLQEISQMHSHHGGATAVITDLAVSWYFFIVSWCIFYVALSYAARVRHAERDAASFRSQAQTAQLKALRYQINPHFLFNTLNALSALVLQKRSEDAEAMINNLATFFRSSLTSDPAADVALQDEIDMQRLYLDIERIRFPERLSVVMDIPEELKHALVPGMLLQPLVENAIRHGVARSGRPVTVSIRAWSEGGRLHLIVEDNADMQSDTSPGNGVGLKNVSDRLAARFGGKAHFHYGPREGGGFRVSLDLPLSADA